MKHFSDFYFIYKYVFSKTWLIHRILHTIMLIKNVRVLKYPLWQIYYNWIIITNKVYDWIKYLVSLFYEILFLLQSNLINSPSIIFFFKNKNVHTTFWRHLHFHPQWTLLIEFNAKMSLCINNLIFFLKNYFDVSLSSNFYFKDYYEKFAC